MDNITQKWIPILDEKNKVRGALVPYYIHYDHGIPKQILYVYEEEHQQRLGGPKEYYKGIDNAPYAMKAKFDINRNLENMFPNEDINVILMRPLNIFHSIDDDVESDDVMDTQVNAYTSISDNFKIDNSSVLQEHITGTLTYRINVASEEIIRRFLNLPLYTHLIIFTRNL